MLHVRHHLQRYEDWVHYSSRLHTDNSVHAAAANPLDWPQSRTLSDVEKLTQENLRKIPPFSVLVDAGMGDGNVLATLKNPHIYTVGFSLHRCKPENQANIDFAVYSPIPHGEQAQQAFQQLRGNVQYVIETYGPTTYAPNPIHSLIFLGLLLREGGQATIMASSVKYESSEQSPFGFAITRQAIHHFFESLLNLTIAIARVEITSAVKATAGDQCIDYKITIQRPFGAQQNPQPLHDLFACADLICGLPSPLPKSSSWGTFGEFAIQGNVFGPTQADHQSESRNWSDELQEIAWSYTDVIVQVQYHFRFSNRLDRDVFTIQFYEFNRTCQWDIYPKYESYDAVSLRITSDTIDDKSVVLSDLVTQAHAALRKLSFNDEQRQQLLRHADINQCGRVLTLYRNHHNTQLLFSTVGQQSRQKHYDEELGLAYTVSRPDGESYGDIWVLPDLFDCSARSILASPIAKNYNIFVPDLPGFGDSIMPLGPMPMAKHVHHMQQLIQKHSRDKPMILIGHEAGGTLATLLANESALNVSQLLLINGLVAPEQHAGNVIANVLQFESASKFKADCLVSLNTCLAFEDYATRIIKQVEVTDVYHLYSWSCALMNALQSFTVAKTFNALTCDKFYFQVGSLRSNTNTLFMQRHEHHYVEFVASKRWQPLASIQNFWVTIAAELTTHVAPSENVDATLSR